MSTQTLSTSIHAKPSGAVAAEVVPAGGGQFSVQGGGSSYRGVLGSPAETVDASAHTTTNETRNFLKVVSPIVELVERPDGDTAKTVQFITDATADLERFCAFVTSGDLARAEEMCRERLLLAPDGQPAARWTKDLSIVRCVEGRSHDALDLLASRYQTALGVGGAFAGRYELTFGQAYRDVGKFDSALLHMTAGRVRAEEADDLLLCARVDTSTGRCLVKAQRPEDSHTLFGRALLIAESESDLLLQGEIYESVALAYEAEGKCEEAFRSAAKSVSILAPTNYEAALKESLETRARLARMKGQR